MTTVHIDITCAPLLSESHTGATGRRTAPPIRRWVARLRRLTQPPRPFQTPSDRVLDGMPEARSINR